LFTRTIFITIINIVSTTIDILLLRSPQLSLIVRQQQRSVGPSVVIVPLHPIFRH
jgi:hypothetical protein